MIARVGWMQAEVLHEIPWLEERICARHWQGITGDGEIMN